MIYELRVYQCVSGRLPALLERFEKDTLRIFARLGIRHVGFWTTMVGESNQQVTYMLAWESLAEKERVWASLLADPEWLEVRARTEKDGPIVAQAKNELLSPTAFSLLQ
ncbi:MAG: NIPSNAP family protein [Mesorhizobium sp.]|nr:NIPSNAP family protein [Mesorhizobium sp.]